MPSHPAKLTPDSLGTVAAAGTQRPGQMSSMSAIQNTTFQECLAENIYERFNDAHIAAILLEATEELQIAYKSCRRVLQNRER